MGSANITIDGRQISAPDGQTVLEAAAANGIDIPTLCHHPALKPQGSCRMCLVEVEKQRALQPACTYPISDGMVVLTESPKVQAARKFVLELLFSERQHYCMYCAMSGDSESSDCELQRLAYRYGLTNWEYAPNYGRHWPLDASRKYFIMDHSRCILCRRCIRACDEIVANHTLGVRERGTRTMIIADDDVPFGASGCVECGTCLQVCPTGALMDRRSAYMGHQTDVQRTVTTCMACAVGCSIEAVARSNRLLRVEGHWESTNGGLLCVDGRFKVLETVQQRVMMPMVRRDGQLLETSWDEALAVVATGLEQAESIVGLASTRNTVEDLAAFKQFIARQHNAQVGLLHGEAPPIDLGAAATLDHLSQADTVVVISGEPLANQKVAGYLVKRAVDQGATLVVVNDEPTELDGYARARLPLGGLDQLGGMIAAAERPVVLYGAGLAPDQYALLRSLPGKVRFMPLITGSNALGAARLGLSSAPVQGDALFVLAADDLPDGASLPPAGFTVAHAAYQTAWTETADVVLPAPIWCEVEGHIVTMQGNEMPLVAFIKAPLGIWSAQATLLGLARSSTLQQTLTAQGQ